MARKVVPTHLIGARVRDRVTGFSGICIGVTRWLTGCDSIGIAPETLGENGKQIESGWFDETRIEVVLDQALVAAEKGLQIVEEIKQDERGGSHETPRQGY